MVRYPVHHYRCDGTYNSLEEYLFDVFKVGIWNGYELEYLQVSTPSLNLKLILNRDPTEIGKLKEQIKFHIKLMLIIDWIY